MSETPSINAEAPFSVQPNLNPTTNLMTRLDAFLPLIKKANQELSGVDVLRLDTHLQEENGNESGDDDDDNDDDSNGEERNVTKCREESSRVSDHKSLELSHGDMIGPSNPTIQIEFAVGELNDNPILKLLATNSDSSDDDDGQKNNVDGNDDANERKRVVTKLLAVDDTSEVKQPLRKKSLITEL